MHYVDEGQGPADPLRPRHARLVLRLAAPDQGAQRRGYRCIAPDNLGFGLSDKPPDCLVRAGRAGTNLRALIEHLGLRDVTLVLHDFGGPFGLSYAIDRPATSGLGPAEHLAVVAAGRPALRALRQALRRRLGRFLYLRLNFSVRVIMKQAIADQSRFPRHIQEQYPRPFGSRRRARGDACLCACAARRRRVVRWPLAPPREDPRHPGAHPLGHERPGLPRPGLDRLQTMFSHKRTACFHDAGHFPQEERPERAVSLVEISRASGRCRRATMGAKASM